MSYAPGDLARVIDAAARGEVPGVPPLPERAAELFGVDGWLRRLEAVGTARIEVAPHDVLRELLREVEEEWNRRLRDLLGRLTRIEAAAAGLGDDGREAVRAEIAEIAAQVAYLRERSARDMLAELGILPSAATGLDEAGQPDLAGELLALLGGWTGRGAGTTPLKALRARRADGAVTHWQVIRKSPAEPGPAIVFRQVYAPAGSGTAPVAVYLDDDAAGGGRLAADAAERAARRAGGSLVFQVTAAEVRALAAGDDVDCAPYEDDAQAAARRAYKILGGDPAELGELAWQGAARTVLAYLTDPDPERWRRVATATLAGLLTRPGGWRAGLADDNFAERARASLYGDALPVSAGRERTLIRVLDVSGCPVTVLIDQRAIGPDSPLGSWSGLVVLDDRPPAIRASESLHRRRWAAWLSWGNLVQFTDGGAQLAYTGLDAFDPGTVPAAAPRPASAMLSQPMPKSAWPATALITVVQEPDRSRAATRGSSGIGSQVMEQRVLGKTGWPVSVIGLGTWQLGADWGSVTEHDALAVLRAAVESGVTFLDTADVYGDGRSERLIGRFLAESPGHGITVATKMGRRVAQVPENYTLANFRAWTDRSRTNLGVDRLDLVQLHCPPTLVYHSDATYEALDTLVAEERIAAYGVSVETCDEALAAIARPGVATVQIIFNAFRRKPLDQVLPAAAAAGVGMIVRVPLASGLLSGRYTLETVFAADDHRTYNRHGEAFDVGETFSGVDYATGVRAAAAFTAIVAEADAFAPEAGGAQTGGPVTTAQAALRWVIGQPGVTTVIPGARNPEQARQNAAAAAVPPLSEHALDEIEALYDTSLRAEIHPRW